MARGGSKVFTAIISFLLGFVFAILAIAGVGFGLYYYVINADLDEIFALINFDNQDDEGRQYVNTSSEDGVTTVLDLLSKLNNMYSNITNQTIGSIENLFPAFDGLTKQIYNALSDYVEISEKEIEEVKFVDMAEYIGNVVMQIQPKTILTNLGMADSLKDNDIVWAILAGAEAQYVTDASDIKYPLYYDEYVLEESGEYFRSGTDDSGVYPSTICDSDGNSQAEYWLTESAQKDDDGNVIYRQYFFPVKDGEKTTYYITKKGSDGNFIFTPATYGFENTSIQYLYDYGSNYNYCTGNYYIDTDGNEVTVSAVTLESLTTNAFRPLYFLSATAIVGEEGIMADLLGDVSVGELIDGSVDFNDIVESLKITTLVDATIDQKILVYLCYNVTGVVEEDDGTYTGTYKYKETDEDTGKETEFEVKVNIEVDSSGKVTSVKRVDNNEEIDAVSVGDVSGMMEGIMDSLTLGDVITVGSNKILQELADTPISKLSEKLDTLTLDVVLTEINPKDDHILMYLVYGITNIKEVEDGEGKAIENFYSGTCEDGSTCYIEYVPKTDTEDAKIIFYKDKEKGEDNIIEVEATSINDITGKVNGITENLTLGDVMDVKDSMLEELGDTKISQLSNEIENLSLGKVISVEYDSPIMMYIAYGLTNVTKDSDGKITGTYKVGDDTYTATITLKDEENSKVVATVTRDEKDTTEGDLSIKIGGVSDQVGKIMDNLALADVIDVDPSSNVMMYIAYGITNVNKEGENLYSGIYHYKDGDEDKTVKVYITSTTNSDGEKITGFYANEDCDTVYKVEGTTVNGVADRVSDIMETLTLGELITVDPSSNIMMYIAYSITGVKSYATTEDYTVYKGTYNGSDCYIKVVDDKIAGFYKSYDGSEFGDELTVAGTTIDGVSAQVSDIMDKLTLGELITVDPSSNIMMYIAYGITGVKLYATTDNYTVYKGTYDNGDCYIKVVGSDIVGFYKSYNDGKFEGELTVTGTTINGVSAQVENLMDNLALADVIDVDPESAIMMYMAYGLTDVTENNDGTYNGTYTVGDKTYTATITVKDNEAGDGKLVDTVTRDADDKTTGGLGVTINKVSAQVNGVMDNLTLGDVVEIEDSKILKKLENTKISNLATEINALTLPDVVDVDPESNIMMYIAYSITGVTLYDTNATYKIYAGTYNGATVYIKYEKTQEGDGSDSCAITGFYSDPACTEGNEVEVAGTPVNGVATQVDGLMNKLTLGELIDVSPSSPIMMYIAYSISGVTQISNTVYKGTYEDNTIYIKTDAKGYVAGFYENEGCTTATTVNGTVIGSISSQVDKLMDNITLGEVVTVSPSSSIMMYIAYSISGVNLYATTEDYTVYKGTYDNGDCYIKVVGSDIVGFYKSYNDGKFEGELTVTGTTIKGVSAQVENLMDNITLGEVVDVDPSSSIMMYIAYSISGVKAVEGKTNTYTGTYHYKDSENKEQTVTVYITSDGSKVTGFYSNDACTEAYTVQGTTIKGVSTQVSGLMDNLTLGEVLTVSEDNKILEMLKDEPISKLDPAINNLTIQQLYNDEIYDSGATLTVVDASSFNSYYVYYTYDSTNEKYVLAGTKGKVTEYTEGLYTYGATTGIWKLLLSEIVTVDDVQYYNEKVYYINGISEMINNVSKNIGEATLFALADAGIIGYDSVYNNYGEANQTKKTLKLDNSIYIGDLTIKQLISYLT